MLFNPGTLLNLAIAKTDYALDCGALQPIATDFDYIEAGSIRFLVRILANLQRKIADKKQQNLKKTNPFLPYDPDLFVADITSTHLCLLNKFNAVDNHILIVTREYESQDNWLTLADFEALSISIAEIDALGFYNGGKLAGSSQPHKHLQLIPLPLSPDGMRLPIEIAIATAKFQDSLGKIKDFSFVHALVRLPDLEPLDLKSAAAELLRQYHLLLTFVGLSPHGTLQTGAYNLLVTREWMMIVLRSQESFQRIGVNALGFAGALLVADAEQLAQLKALSPLQLLEAVAVRSEK
jgi:ATP adenylyltransferase